MGCRGGYTSLSGLSQAPVPVRGSPAALCLGFCSEHGFLGRSSCLRVPPRPQNSLDLVGRDGSPRSWPRSDPTLTPFAEGNSQGTHWASLRIDWRLLGPEPQDLWGCQRARPQAEHWVGSHAWHLESTARPRVWHDRDPRGISGDSCCLTGPALAV